MNQQQKERLASIIRNGCKAGGKHVVVNEDGNECHCIVMDMALEAPPIKQEKFTAILRENNACFIQQREVETVRNYLCCEFGLTVGQLKCLQNANDDVGGCCEAYVESRRKHIMEELERIPVTESPASE